MEITIDDYFRGRYTFFKWRSETSTVNKIILAFFMACITGVMAQVVIPLPWTPVPVTAQTFAVLIAGILLGRYWGGLSQAIYLGVGVAGVPWFGGMTGGLGILTGATGGYLVGFVLAALFLGYFADKFIKARNFLPMLALMLFANFALIYIPGMLQLGAWTYAATGSQPGMWTIMVMGLLPFLAGDLVKIGGAAAFAKAVTPKEPFNGD
ncbi:biotin transporter BioY [Methanobacterium aggregans]|uniref:biotin transporter BioY n=1 Tax=Methanobacterium aggregans TaxID=1615586 RepID=UPI001AEA8702|nr:biotin transporter BioY [Methanobacterium aggregans]MBP2045645.1 biotin transport system substrate-specific component [Methanobacterium aggregans]